MTVRNDKLAVIVGRGTRIEPVPPFRFLSGDAATEKTREHLSVGNSVRPVDVNHWRNFNMSDSTARNVQVAAASTVAQRMASRPSAGALSPMETASRLLGETAHDLRTPLCAVRESARLVNDGYLGPTTEEQRVCLQGIFEQCEAMDHLITDMLSLEQLRSGLPRVHRAWIDPSSIQQAVTSTIAASLSQRDVALVWDRAETLSTVFADSSKVARLLLNLIGNSLQVVPRGGQVLIRTEAVEARGTMRFTVIDHGAGIDGVMLRRLVQRGQSGTDGKGLGLAISRQMAALHFSPLEISSRPGEGTRVVFELPCAGPASVADAWIRWRESFHAKPRKPLRRAAGVRLDEPQARPRSATGLAAAGSAAEMIVLRHEGPPPRSPGLAVAVSLRLGSAVPTDVATKLDRRLQDSMGIYELAYRADVRRWIVLIDADQPQSRQRIASLEIQLNAHLPTARITCSEQVGLAIGVRASRASLRDLLIRDSLGSSGTLPTSDDRKLRSAGPLPAISEVASRRLDAELRRLTTRIAGQRERLQHQAAAVRTPAS